MMRPFCESPCLLPVRKRITLYNPYTPSRLRGGSKARGVALSCFRLTRKPKKMGNPQNYPPDICLIPIMYYPLIAILFYNIWSTFVRTLWLISFTEHLLLVHGIRLILWGDVKGIGRITHDTRSQLVWTSD